jgi:hypothetical protein
MTTAEFENYCFLRLYSIDLNTAAHAIAILKRYRKADEQVALLRDIAVTYSRPFSVNHGNEHRTHQLAIKHVPRQARGLHNRLLDLRNSLTPISSFTTRKLRGLALKKSPGIPCHSSRLITKAFSGSFLKSDLSLKLLMKV